jgi:plasmid stabilization system protein ParE
MGFVLSSQAEAELDDIWLYIARESGSTDIANRFIDMINDRFWMLSKFPQIGRRRVKICGRPTQFSRGRIRDHLPNRGGHGHSPRHPRQPGH